MLVGLDWTEDMYRLWDKPIMTYLLKFEISDIIPIQDICTIKIV